MTLRRTEIIEWSTTPQQLRIIADHLENNLDELYRLTEKNVTFEITIDEGQWQAEQMEED